MENIYKINELTFDDEEFLEDIFQEMFPEDNKLPTTSLFDFEEDNNLTSPLFNMEDF
jgi:hypothetical protein